jgi:LytS/YehU family sensor histidine kinase
MIPGMILQPIIENSLNHGLFPKKKHDGVITIRICKVDSARFFRIEENVRMSNQGRLLIQIVDNGQGREASAANRARRYSQSFGMRGIEERLRWISQKFGVYAGMEVTDLKDENGNAAGTCLLLNLPLTEEVSYLG